MVIGAAHEGQNTALSLWRNILEAFALVAELPLKKLSTDKGQVLLLCVRRFSQPTKLVRRALKKTLLGVVSRGFWHLSFPFKSISLCQSSVLSGVLHREPTSSPRNLFASCHESSMTTPSSSENTFIADPRLHSQRESPLYTQRCNQRNSTC